MKNELDQFPRLPDVQMNCIVFLSVGKVFQKTINTTHTHTDTQVYLQTTMWKKLNSILCGLIMAP